MTTYSLSRFTLTLLKIFKEVLQGAITVNLSAGLELFAQAVGGLAILFYVSW